MQSDILSCGPSYNYKSGHVQKLWEREQWTDLEHIRSEAKTFLMRHNNRQDWKYRKTDLKAIPHRKLPEDFEIGADSLPIREGKLHFIRQVKGDGTISVLNEDFDVSESLAHEYVWATIDTKQEQLKVYYREKNAE